MTRGDIVVNKQGIVGRVEEVGPVMAIQRVDGWKGRWSEADIAVKLTGRSAHRIALLFARPLPPPEGEP